MTLTLSGYEGNKITGITLNMKSNTSKGAGTLSATAGETTIASIADAKFNDSSWNGAWSTDYVNVPITMSNDSYEIQEGEDVVITIAATENSLYCLSFTLTYESVGDESVATTVSIDDAGITNTDVYVGTEAGSLAATVNTMDAAIEDATVTWSGDNDAVATIDAETGAVTLVAAGTVNFTAAYAGVQGEYKASSATYELEVTSSAPYVQPTTVEINMNYQWLGSSNTSNLSADQLPVVNTDDNVTTTITDGTSTSPRGDTDYIRLYKGSTITFAAPEGYLITEIEFTTGGNNTWNAPTPDSGELSSKTWTGEAESIVFTLESGNCFISKATVTLEANTPKVLSAITLSGEYPTTFHQGDEFSHEGMTVTAEYEGGKTADVTASATFSGYDMDNTGVQTVTVSYTENEVTKTATYEITVNAPATLTSISLSGTYPTVFQQGDAFSSEGIVVTANYDDNTTSDVTDEAAFSGYDMNTIGEQTVTVTFEDKTASYGITVVEKKGTEDNPYTVAEAIEATPASGTSDKVYIQGIVSAFYNTSIVGDGSNYRYYISDDGTTENQLLVYKGKGLNNEAFSSADDLKIGDEVVIYGGLTTYKNDAEVASGNYIVSLNRPVTPSIAVSTTTVDATAEEAEGTITVTYNNITEVEAEVQFCDAEGNDATYDWITAEINKENNNIDYIIDENTSTEARTAYMKVYALYDEANEVYSELITVTQAGVVVDYATLPFEFDGGLADIKNTNGLSQDDLGSDYKSSPYLKFDDTGDCLILKINERPGKLTFDIKGNSFSDGTFTVQTSEDGETYTDLKKYKAFGSSLHNESFNGLGENVRYIKWIYTEKVNGNVALGNITLAKYKPISLTLNASGFATFASTEALDFTGYATADYKAWQATSTESSTLKFTQITSTVKAGTGILITGTAGATITLTTATEGEDISATNLLVGFTEATEVADGEYFGLSGDEFVKVKAGTVPAGKALLPASVGTSVKSFSFAFEGNATGIKSLSDSPLQGETIVNLAGQRLQKMQKGINIVNGKKVLY